MAIPLVFDRLVVFVFQDEWAPAWVAQGGWSSLVRRNSSRCLFCGSNTGSYPLPCPSWPPPYPQRCAPSGSRVKIALWQPHCQPKTHGDTTPLNITAPSIPGSQATRGDCGRDGVLMGTMGHGIQSSCAAAPLYGQVHPGCLLAVCLGSKSPQGTEGVIYPQHPQPSPERAARAGRGLSLAFASHSSTSHTIARVLQKRPLPILCLFLVVLKCSSQEKSCFSAGFGLLPGHVRSSRESEAVANTTCCASVGYIPSPFLAVRWRTAARFIALWMDKESLVPGGTLSCWCFFSTWRFYVTKRAGAHPLDIEVRN